MEEKKMHYMRPKDEGLSLHLGCGDYWKKGSINIDMAVYGGTDMLLDIRKPLPFQPETIKLIEAYEVIEHMNKDELHNILEDWKRVLITGGRISVSVPDMDEIIEMYEVDPKKALEEIYGLEDHPHHKQGFTKESLEAVFIHHGFKVLSCIKGEMTERPGEKKILLIAQKS